VRVAGQAKITLSRQTLREGIASPEVST
jgi:hypothetical protein